MLAMEEKKLARQFCALRSSSSSGALIRRHPAHAARRMNLFTIRERGSNRGSDIHVSPAFLPARALAGKNAHPKK